MNIPVQTKPALWGIAGGAILLAIVGFSWGGWTTASTAASTTQSQVDAAVVAALAPVCVDKFRRSGDAAANLAALRKVDSGAQGEFVEKGGWAAVPGNNSSDRVSAVARSCAELLLTTT
jgi:pimeloyl-ACP methyl ester carboxylesterase